MSDNTFANPFGLGALYPKGGEGRKREKQRKWRGEEKKPALHSLYPIRISGRRTREKGRERKRRE